MAIEWGKLADFFPASEIKWKPQSVKGARCFAVPYITARIVMDRLDLVVGVSGWQDEYTLLPNGSVLCTLRVFDGQQWISKSDVGSESDQSDDGDKLKAAVSDALKRAAVKFGIGRYLYAFPKEWVNYDPAKRAISETPKIPIAFMNAEDREAAIAKEAEDAARAKTKQQQTKQPAPGNAAVDEVRSLLVELATLRKIDPASMFNLFAGAFCPGIKAVKDIPQNRLAEAAKQLRMKIEIEKRV